LQAHCRQIWSTNPLKRINKEIKRRTDVVGVFFNAKAPLRLAGATLMKQHEEWATSDRRYFSETSMTWLIEMTQPEGQVNTPELMTT